MAGRLSAILIGAITFASISYLIAYNDYQQRVQANASKKAEYQYASLAEPVKSGAEEIAANSLSLQKMDLSAIEPAAGKLPEKFYDEDNPVRYKRNASPVPLHANKAYIALVIDDLGVIEELSQRAVDELPPEITMSFLPYGDSTLELAVQAREENHEIMIHLPMEALANREGEYPDPGENALTSELSDKEITELVQENLFSLKSIAVGINNHMGSKFTADLDKMKLVMKAIEKEQLFFLDSLTTNQSVGRKAAQGLNIPFVARDIFIDHVKDKQAIRQQLDKLTEQALKRGYAIGIGHPHEKTLDVLKVWLDEIAQRDDIQLIPITTTLKWQK